jgi:hypothetical protein
MNTTTNTPEVKIEAKRAPKRIIIRDKQIKKDIGIRVQRNIVASENKELTKNYLKVKVVTRRMLDELAADGYQNRIIDFMLFPGNGCEPKEVVEELLRYDLVKPTFDKNGNEIRSARTNSKGRVNRHHARDYEHVIGDRAVAIKDCIKKAIEASTPEELTVRFSK